MHDGLTEWKARVKQGARDLGRKTSPVAETVASGMASGARCIGDAMADGAGFVADKARSAAGHVQAQAQAGALLAFLHPRVLLKWFETVTESPECPPEAYLRYAEDGREA